VQRFYQNRERANASDLAQLTKATCLFHSHKRQVVQHTIDRSKLFNLYSQPLLPETAVVVTQKYGEILPY